MRIISIFGIPATIGTYNLSDNLTDNLSKMNESITSVYICDMTPHSVTKSSSYDVASRESCRKLHNVIQLRWYLEEYKAQNNYHVILDRN